jgi:hypothetical protein
MARISTYPIISTPTLNDLLIGTDVDDLNITKNFLLGDVATIISNDFVPYVGATGNVNLGVFSIEAASFIVEGGLASEFVKADGSLDSTIYTPQSRTLTINSVTFDLSANRSWDLNTIDTLTTTGTNGPATYIGKTLNIPQYQAQGNYITQLSGEATAMGPGNATVTLSNLAVISKVLTGLNITGGTVVDTDSILTAFGKVQNQINGLAGGVTYEGTWNATTNVPFLQSSVGVQGHYYVVSVAGTTNLNGITDWQLGDWAIFNGSVWEKVDNTDAVVSVNGYTGAVVLTFSDVGAPPATRNLTINGVQFDLTADRTWTVGDVRTDQTYANPTWITSLAWTKITGTPTTLAGYGITDGVSSSRTITINGVTFDLTANRTWNVGTVTSVGTSGPLTGGTITGSGTIGITQSGASSDGYLSSTDWNTFNNKQNALTNPVTGTGTIYTLPMWSGATSLVDSPLSYGPDAFNFQYNSATGGTVNFTNIGLTSYTYSIQMNNFGSPRSTVHSYTDGVVVQSIAGTQVSRMFANGNFILGDGAADNGYKLAVEGNVYIETIANAITDTDRFIVSDGGVIKYRTGTELLGDIGAQGSITLTTTGTSGAATLIGNTLNIPQYTDQFVGTVTSVAALTLGTSGTDLSSTVANSTTTPVITLNVPTASAVNRGALSAADWTTFNNKQPAGNYITSLIGEATATGPGAASVTLDNTAVIGKVLTGLNVTGGTIISTDNILSAFGKVQNQINGLIGGSIFQGTWNASTNTPTLTSGVGTNGHYYIVSVDGSTNLDGITDWKVGDWAIFAGTTWEKIDNTDAVNSVNGYTGIVSLVTGDVLEGAGTLPGRPSQLYFTDARSRAAISLTTTGTSGPATYSNVTGILNIPNYTTDLTGYVPYTGANQTVNLNTQQLQAGHATFTTNGTTDTLTVNHTSGSGYGIIVTKGGNNEALYVNKTGGSGNAMTVVGGRTSLVDLALSSVTNTVGDFLTISGGVVHKRTAAEVRTDIGAQGTITLTTTGTSGVSTLIGSTLNIPNYTTDLSGYVTLDTTQTITGLKTIVRVGAAIDVLDFKIGADTIYGLKVAYNQNELEASGEATWSLVNTFNRNGAGFSVTPISFFRGVLVTGERLLSASINSNLLNYYSNNPTGRYPIYAYNTGVQQFASSIIVGETAGVVNVVTGAIADLPSGVVANFKGRVIGSDAVNNNEFATLGQVTSTSRAAISLTTTGTSGPATYSSVTGVLNIPEYQGGVTSFNTRTGAVTLTSSDVTTALGYTPVTDARTLSINGVTYDLTANRSWTVGVNPSAREIETFIATASQTTFTVTGGYTVGLVDVFINGVRLTSSDYTATNGTTVVLTVGTMAGNIVDIIKYTSGFTNAVSGTGTSGQVAYFTGTTTISSESNLFWDATNDKLGIGTNVLTNGKLVISDSGPNKISLTGGTLQNGIRWEAVDGANTFYLFNGTNNSSGFGLYNVNTTLFNFFVPNSGNFLINTTTDAGFKLDVNGTGRFSGSATFVGQIIANAAETNTVNPVTSGNIIISGGYSSIRTALDFSFNIDVYNSAAPINALKITQSGAATFSNSITSTLSTGIFLANSSGGTNATAIRISNTSGDLRLGIESSTGGTVQLGTLAYAAVFGNQANAATQFTTNGTARMTITSGGNVGIGTASPDIFSRGYTTTLGINSATGDTGIHINGGTSSGAYIDLGNSGTRRMGIISTAAESQIISLGSVPLVLKTNSVERIFITSGGNVLIGTTTDSGQRLQVNGSGKFSSNVEITGYLFLEGSGNSYNIRCDGSNNLNIALGGSERMRITSVGRGLFGTTTASVGAGGFGSSSFQVNNEIVSIGSLAGLFWENRSGGVTDTSNWYGWYTSAGTIFLYNGSANIASINTTTGAYTDLSDKNKKKDFEYSNVGLDAVMGLKPTFYRMKDDESKGSKELGFIAQEVKEFIPQAYVENGEDAAKFIGLNYNAIVAALVKSVQELKAELDELKSKN